MEWEIKESIHEAEMADFAGQLDMRNANNTTGGLWNTFHNDGGSTIFFGPCARKTEGSLSSSSPTPVMATDNEWIFNSGNNGKVQMICGTKRPLAALSMVPYHPVHVTIPVHGTIPFHGTIPVHGTIPPCPCYHTTLYLLIPFSLCTSTIRR